jgi:hypothetical protein
MPEHTSIYGISDVGIGGHDPEPAPANSAPPGTVDVVVDDDIDVDRLVVVVVGSGVVEAVDVPAAPTGDPSNRPPPEAVAGTAHTTRTANTDTNAAPRTRNITRSSQTRA